MNHQKELPLKVREHVASRLNIRIDHLTYHLSENSLLQIRGGIYANDNYKDPTVGELIIQADLVDQKDGILCTLCEWGRNTLLEKSGYDTFCLTDGNFSRVTDIEKIAGIWVYAEIKRK